MISKYLVPFVKDPERLKRRGQAICASRKKRAERRSSGLVGPWCGSCGTTDTDRFPKYRGGNTLCRPCRYQNFKMATSILRRKVIDLYGGSCWCCGETQIEFLSIDHLNDDGADERRKNRLTGINSYRMLLYLGKRREDIALACQNCNTSRGYFGYCPHQAMKVLAG